MERDRDTLKKLKIVKGLALREVENVELDLHRMGVLNGVLGCLLTLFIYKELTNDLGVDKVKLQSRLSSLFRLMTQPENFD